MKNIVNATDLAEILERLDSLTPESERQWGTMTVNQALVHMADQFRVMYGEIEAKDVSSFGSRNLTKGMVLKMEKFDENTPTLLEINQLKGNGTPPTDFENDKFLLKKILLAFSLKKNHDLQPHPYFGNMALDQFGRLAWQHLDHHLRQFGA